MNYQRLAPPELTLRKIVNPLKIRKHKPTEKDIALLKEWNSVRDYVGNSVRYSVEDSVGNSVSAYIGSFFTLPRDKWLYTEKMECKGYPFQCAVDLWNRGFVSSLDGKTWRLHSGPKMEVVYEWKVKS